MDERGRTFVKWVLAIIVLAAVVVYALQNVGDAFRAGLAFGDDAGGPGEQDAALPTGPVTDGVAPPQADFTLLGPTVGPPQAPALTIGPAGNDGVVLSFPVIDGDPACVQSARIDISVVEATPTELAVYPSRLTDLPSLSEGQQVPEDPVIAVDAPPIAFTDGTPGRLVWDVTELYRTFVTAGSFSGGDAPTIGTPFTVVIRPTGGDQPGRVVAFDSSEAPEPALGPALVWSGVPGCGGASEAAAA
jgi:hypothetical protein